MTFWSFSYKTEEKNTNEHNEAIFFLKRKTFLPCDSTNKKCQDKKGKVIIGGEKDSNRAKKYEEKEARTEGQPWLQEKPRVLQRSKCNTVFPLA